jgi:hypothetical protein
VRTVRVEGKVGFGTGECSLGLKGETFIKAWAADDLELLGDAEERWAKLREGSHVMVARTSPMQGETMSRMSSAGSGGAFLPLRASLLSIRGPSEGQLDLADSGPMKDGQNTDASQGQPESSDTTARVERHDRRGPRATGRATRSTRGHGGTACDVEPL